MDTRSGIASSKLQQLVRVGLIDPSQFSRLKKALSKEDFSKLSKQERDLLLDTFHKLLDHILSNQQLFQRTKSVLATEELDHYEVVHSKLIKDGWKQKNPSEPVYEKDGKTKTLLVKDNKVVRTFGEAKSNETYADDFVSKKGEKFDFSLPVLIILRRKAIRVFPDGKKVGLYYSDKLKRYFSIPSSGDALSEEMTIDLSEASNAGNVLDILKGILENRESAKITFRNGSSMTVNFVTAHAVMAVYNRLENAHNKVKFEKMLNKDKPSFMKMLDFTSKHHK